MNYYEILGVDKSATDEEIAAAYRKKALEYHPDRNPGNEEAANKFKEAAESFEVLSNHEKRRMYDNPSLQGVRSGGGSPFDTFNSFFGEQWSKKRGVDSELRVSITFEESVLGCKKEVELAIKSPCCKCSGSGISDWNICSSCNGMGKRTVKQDPFVIQMSCHECGGRGRTVAKTCNHCVGKGYTEDEKELININIPAGSFNGLVMRVGSKGDYDDEGHRGDLHIVIQVEPHALFERYGNDIICEVLVPYSKMVLGGEVIIPKVQGEVFVKIKSGTKDGTKMRMQGLGVKNINNPSIIGDMHIILRVDIPTNIDEDYEKAIQQLSCYES